MPQFRAFENKLIAAAEAYSDHRDQFTLLRTTAKEIVAAESFPTLEINDGGDDYFYVKFAGGEWALKHQYNANTQLSTISTFVVTRFGTDAADFAQTERRVEFDKLGNVTLPKGSKGHVSDDADVRVVLFTLIGLASF